MSKKKILAIILFLIFGFTLFTFANPASSQDVEKLDSDETNNQQEQTNNIDDNQETVINNQEQNVNANNNVNNGILPVFNNNDNNYNNPFNTKDTNTIPTLVIDENNVYAMEINTAIPEFKATGYADDKEIEVKISNNINPAKVGKYVVVFEVTIDENTVKVEKTFTVVDTKAPVFITKDNTNAKEVLIEVEDDSEVTIKIINKETKEVAYIENGKTLKVNGTYEVIATDENGNTSKITITVNNIKPIITLNGKEEVVVRLNNEYKDLGATAKDDLDGDITDKIVTENDVDTNKKATYKVKFNVEDSAKNKADEVTRTVYVVSVNELLDAIDEGNKIIDLVNNKETDKEIIKLIEELEDLINEGKDIIDDNNSKQDVIDSKEEEIRNIINEITNKTFKITYVDYNDKEIVSYDVEFGKDATIPNDPERKGYDFIGWDNKATNVIKNMTIKALYKAKEDTPYLVNLKYENLDGTFNIVPENKKGISDSKVVITPEYVKGYVTPSQVTEKIESDGSTVINIEYLRIRNKVTFNINNKLYFEKDYMFGETIEYPYYELDKRIYFSGWMIDDEIMGDKPRTYNAEEYVKTFKVYFMNGNKKFKEVTVEYGEDVNLKEVGTPNDYMTNLNTYKYIGWDGEVTNITHETYVKAKFEENTRYYTVNFYDNNGLNKTLTDVTYGENITSKAPTASAKDNYTFSSWDKNLNDITSNINVNKTSTIDVTAIYTANQTGIKVEKKNISALEFEQDSNTNINNYINVYAVYADGTKTLVNNYSTDFTTSTVGTKKLNVTANGFNNSDIEYKVVPKVLTVKIQYLEKNGNTAKLIEDIYYVNKGESIELPKIKTNQKIKIDGTQYEFTGWSHNGKNIQDNITIEALYKANGKQYGAHDCGNNNLDNNGNLNH